MRQKKPVIAEYYWVSPEALKECFDYDQNEDILIFVLRNYRECMMNRWYNRSGKPLQDEFCIASLGNLDIDKRYFDYLNLYDTWNPKTRFIFYYEDIISDPYSYFNSILDIMGEDKSNLDNYFSTLNDTKDQYFKRYKGTARSRGKDPLFHSKKLSYEVCFEADKIIKNEYPELYDKYMYIYKP